MKNKVLVTAAGLLGLTITAMGQPTSLKVNSVAVYVGLQLQNQPVSDVGIMLKHYWLFDSALVSNSGPGAGWEINFGTNNSGITIGPKVFYQTGIYMGSFGHKKKEYLNLILRLSAIRYTNKYGNDYRLAPEGGISFSGRLSLLYGYNFPIPLNGNHEKKGVFGNRLTLFITFEKRKLSDSFKTSHGF